MCNPANRLSTSIVPSRAVSTTNAAQRVDTKLDDGAPNGGTVGAVAGSINSETCMTANGNTGIYNEAAQANVCAIYIGVQG